MKKIVLFTDSLALPRECPETTFVEDTYPYMLSFDFKVFQCSMGGGRISDLAKQTFYYKQYKPDYVILQSGIVDCAPRAFTWEEEQILGSCFIGRAVRYLIQKTITTRILRNVRQKCWTSEKNYIDNIETIKSAFPGIPVLALSILPAGDIYEKKVHGITEHIKRYNQLLELEFGENLIKLNDIPRDGIMSDGHHLTCEGHKFVYDRIIEMLIP